MAVSRRFNDQSGQQQEEHGGAPQHVHDEALTPDSSRFWPADTYQVGISPPSFDKQYVRDYLETLDWDEELLGFFGIPRAMLFILSDNVDAQAFWSAVGGRERTTLGVP